MKHFKLSEKKWFNGAVIACIAVAFYMLLANLSTVFSSVGFFLRSFSSILLGAIFAYFLNPLAKFYEKKVLRKMKAGNTRWYLSVTLGILTALLAVILLLGTLIPQLVSSISRFSESYDEYAVSLIRMLEGSPLEAVLNAENIETLSQNALTSISAFVRGNAGKILSAAANSGKGILTTALALIVAVYLLIDKTGVLNALWRFMTVTLHKEKADGIMDFIRRCDAILISYLKQSLLESVIVGVVNAIFMLVCGMEYIGLISVIVAVTNLIPNFGPIIGGVIGAFVLLLVNPLHALMFIIFCIVLQFVDGYILKPKLFSGSLGVSGLLILVAGIVLGEIFGVLGMLLSIPAAAILSFVYQDYFLSKLEKRQAQSDAHE
ncbi:MAG: AI-2E family transporter [Oscillospiraceae bacterium]|nr:AI-2E family transporter [Oscillospiraceae bacterium]